MPSCGRTPAEFRAPEGRYMVARGGAPLGARTPGIGNKNKCEPRQGWYNAWHKIPHCFKIPQTQKHAPTTARSSASLRSSLFLSPQVPWVPFKFLILAGVPFANAHSTACLTSFAPFHGASCSAHLRFAYYSLNSDLS